METKKQRTFRTDDEKRGHVDCWKSSGLTQKAYCEEHDIPYKSFEKWVRSEKIKNNTLEPVDFDLSLLAQSRMTAVVTFPSGIQCKFDHIQKARDILLLIREFEQCS